ncbi:hypothetical protein BSKO_03152 [Bryopsis sp. KO-2023]|nr:hypothetical protein BSKO_03152 [Bryopsis sp. KO-2023]
MSRTPPQEPRGRLPGPTASLRPGVVVDNRLVYGGRVIAESEEEYASRRAVVMNQGARSNQGPAKANQIGATGAAGVDGGPQVNCFGILQGNATPRQFAPPHADQFLRYSGHDHGRLVYMPGDIERLDRRGLVRSIGERPGFHAPLEARMAHQGLDSMMQHESQRVALDYHLKQSLSPAVLMPQALKNQQRRMHGTPNSHGVGINPQSAQKMEMDRRRWERRGVGDLAPDGRRIHFQQADTRLDRGGHMAPVQGGGGISSGIGMGGGGAGLWSMAPPGNSGLPAALRLQERMRGLQKQGMLLPGDAVHAPCNPAVLPHPMVEYAHEQAKSMGSFTALLNEVEDGHKAVSGLSTADPESRSHGPAVSVNSSIGESSAKIPASIAHHPNLLDGYRAVNLPISIPFPSRAHIPASPEFSKRGSHQSLPPPQLRPHELHALQFQHGNYRTPNPGMIRRNTGPMNVRMGALHAAAGVWPMKIPPAHKPKIEDALRVATQRRGVSDLAPMRGQKPEEEKIDLTEFPREAHHEALENDDMLRSPFGQTLGTEDLFGDGFGLGDMRPSHDFHSPGMTSGEEGEKSREKAFKTNGNLEEDVPSSLQDVCDGFAEVVSKSMPVPLSSGMQFVDQWKEKFPGVGDLPAPLKTNDGLWDMEEESPLGLTLEELQEVSEIEAHQQDTEGEGEEKILEDEEEEEEVEEGVEENGEEEDDQATNHIEDIEMGPEEPEEEAESEGDDEESEVTTETEEDEAIALNQAPQGRVGMKCPRVFNPGSLPPQPETKRAVGRPPRHKIDPVMKQPLISNAQSAPAKPPKNSTSEAGKTATSEMSDLFASAGIGFDEDESDLVPKSLPRFPKRMAVKQKDVLELAFCMMGKPTSTVHEIQEACKWWLQQSKTEALAASRANVLKNWSGLKMASSFSDGERGVRAILNSMAKDGRFVECGVDSDGQEVWACRRFGKTVDERPSDSDEKTMFWLGEAEDYNVEVEEESIPDIVEREEIAYQRAAKDEWIRRRKLMDIQERLKLRQPTNTENENQHHLIRSVSPLQKFCAHPTVLSEVGASIPRINKRKASWMMLPTDAISKKLWKPAKRKSRSLVDVYTHGPRNTISGDDSSMSPLSDSVCWVSEKAKKSPGYEGVEDSDKKQARKSGMGYGEWVGRCQESYLAGVDIGGILSAKVFREQLSEEEKAGLLKLAPECDHEMLRSSDKNDLFKSPQLQEAMARYRALLDGGLLEPESNSKWFPSTGRGAEARLAREDAIRGELGFRFGKKAADDFLQHNATLPDILLGLHESRE